VDVSSDAGLLGGDGGDDKVRRSTASAWVAAAVSIASCTRTGDRLEASGAAELRAQITAAWGRHARVRRYEVRERVRGFK
jgi:hypothetical protein